MWSKLRLSWATSSPPGRAVRRSKAPAAISPLARVSSASGRVILRDSTTVTSAAPSSTTNSMTKKRPTLRLRARYSSVTSKAVSRRASPSRSVQ